jgi:hypothetical protein
MQMRNKYLIVLKKNMIFLILIIFLSGCAALNEFGSGFEEGLRASGTSYFQSNPAGGFQAMSTVGNSICYTSCLASGLCQTRCH